MEKQHNDYIVDEATRRLMDLTCTPGIDRSENDIDNIILVVMDKAPKLLDGLSSGNQRNLARHLTTRCYSQHEVLFRQGDDPDHYYTVLRGAVSIYALQNTDPTGATDDSPDSANVRDGKFLVQLPPGASFGELSFNADSNHSKRNAGVISDGSHGQTRVQISNPLMPGGGVEDSLIGSGGSSNGITEIEASNIAVLLLIPEYAYMQEMFPRHTKKHQTNDKIAFLKKSIIFGHWPMDQLVKMAYAMKQKVYQKGIVLARQGNRADFVSIVRKGKIKISLFPNDARQLASGANLSSPIVRAPLLGTSDRHIDIAELGVNDMFGLVEVLGSSIANNGNAMQNSKTIKSASSARSSIYGTNLKWQRTATAMTHLEVFVIEMKVFAEFLDYEEKTRDLLEKVVYKRIEWEKLRCEYVCKFPTMPFALPLGWISMSKYIMSKDSLMSEEDLKTRKANSLSFYRYLRDARASLRTALSKSKAPSGTNEAVREMAVAKEFCRKAISLAYDIGDTDLKEQANDLLSGMEQQSKQFLVPNSNLGRHGLLDNKDGNITTLAQSIVNTAHHQLRRRGSASSSFDQTSNPNSTPQHISKKKGRREVDEVMGDDESIDDPPIIIPSTCQDLLKRNCTDALHKKKYDNALRFDALTRANRNETIACLASAAGIKMK